MIISKLIPKLERKLTRESNLAFRDFFLTLNHYSRVLLTLKISLVSIEK